MSNDIHQTELEKKLQKAKEGYLGIAVGGAAFAFPERSISREEVIELAQKGLDLFTEERRTLAAYEAAVEAKEKALPALKQFHADALKVARCHYGADAKKMATFGVEKRAASKAKPRSAKPQQHPHIVGPACGGATLVEEVVTTVVKEVTVPVEEERRRPAKAHCRTSKRSHCKR